MAATVEEIKNKINLYYDSSKMPKFSNIYKARNFNWEPFSLRKTATTLDQIFSKIFSSYKSVHNKKYLQSFFPYYVFYDVILDLDGKIVFYISKQTLNNNYSFKKVFHVKKEFYNQYSEYIDEIFSYHVGGSITDIVIHEDVDDIYFLFHKQYTFANISEIKDFKKELISKISARLFSKKESHLAAPNMIF